MNEIQIGLLLTAYGVYLAGMISPGPAILSILQTSLEDGYRAGLTKSAGVMCASFVWGLCTSLGLMSLIDQYPDILFWMFLIGGLYLLWLGYKAGLKAYLGNLPTVSLEKIGKKTNYCQSFYQGLAIHATNPKAMAVWATVGLSGLTTESSAYQIVCILGGCFLLGSMVLWTYVAIFSRAKVRDVAQKHFRTLYFASCGIYIVLAGKLLLEPLSMIG